MFVIKQMIVFVQIRMNRTLFSFSLYLRPSLFLDISGSLSNYLSLCVCVCAWTSLVLLSLLPWHHDGLLSVSFVSDALTRKNTSAHIFDLPAYNQPYRDKTKIFHFTFPCLFIKFDAEFNLLHTNEGYKLCVCACFILALFYEEKKTMAERMRWKTQIKASTFSRN